MKNPPLHFAVIGDPVEHSLSPAMHQAAFTIARLPHHYSKILVTPKNLASFIRHEAPRLAGFNVTIPHKETILPHLDFLTPKVRHIGAVNTVSRHRGHWVGWNTDGDGYCESLWEETGFVLEGKHVLLLGAGGAARGIAYALLQRRPASLTIVNRSLDRAEILSGDLKKIFPEAKLNAFSFEKKSWHASLQSADLVINATSLGLESSSFTNFPWEKLKAKPLVSDIVYRPRETPWLKQAASLGCPRHFGLGMLLHQGALAFEIWTGIRPDLHAMGQALTTALKNS